MKIKNNIVTSLIIFYVLALWRVEGVEPELGELQHLLEPIRTAKQRIEAAARTAPAEGTSILIGITGSGKTTAFNLLLGTPLCAKRGTTIGNPVVVDLLNPDHQPHYEIREGPVAETKLPDFDQGYCDLPGFNDPRVINDTIQNADSLLVQEIINAYSVNKVLSRINPIKIVAVVNYVHLAGRMTEFSSFLQHVGTIFQNNPAELSESLSLIITRFPQHFKSAEDSAKDFLRGTFRIYENPQNIIHFNPAQRFTLGKLLELNNDRISFLYEPSLVQGDMRVPLDLSSEKTSIENLMRNIRASHNIRPCASLSENALSLINRACTVFNTLVSRAVDSVYSRMPDYINALILNAQNIQNLRGNFREIVSLLENLPLRRENYLQNFDNVLQVFRAINARAEAITTFENVRPFLEFFELTHLPDTINPTVWQNIPNRFVALLRLFETPPHVERRNDVLFMKGLLISTGDILSELARHNYTKINIYALHSLFLDHNIEKSGLNVGFWAPNWISRTQGGKLINLSGINGVNHDAQAQNEHDGVSGSPGNNGGHFYGKLRHFHGASRLTINVGGGNGGNGQSGGKGNDGVHGNPGSSQDVINKACTLYERVKVERNFLVAAASFMFTPLNVKYKETYISGRKGLPGGNGGRGGRGGYGGHGGLIQINDGVRPHAFDLITEVNQESSRGENGASGRGGRGGRHGGEKGSMHKGVYTAEYISPELRGIGIVEADDNRITVEPRIIPVGLGIAAHGIPAVVGAVAHAAPAISRWAAGRGGAVIFSRLGVGAGIGAVFGYVTGGIAVVATAVSPIISNRRIEGPTAFNGNAANGLTPPDTDLNEQGIRNPSRQRRVNFSEDTQIYTDYYTEKRDENELFPLYVSNL